VPPGRMTVAPALLARVDWRGRVLTGDARFCQRGRCRQVLEAGGDYLLLVRQNQPALHRDLALLFDPSRDAPAPLPLLDHREARTLWNAPGGRAAGGSTSLPPAVADAARLFALKRGHGRIENRLHRAKDVALGEDRSLVHVGAGPTVMALLRDTALGLLHRNGCRAVASRLRAHADHPAAALALVRGLPPTRA